MQHGMTRCDHITFYWLAGSEQLPGCNQLPGCDQLLGCYQLDCDQLPGCDELGYSFHPFSNVALG